MRWLVGGGLEGLVRREERRPAHAARDPRVGAGGLAVRAAGRFPLRRAPLVPPRASVHPRGRTHTLSPPSRSVPTARASRFPAAGRSGSHPPRRVVGAKRCARPPAGFETRPASSATRGVRQRRPRHGAPSVKRARARRRPGAGFSRRRRGAVAPPAVSRGGSHGGDGSRDAEPRLDRTAGQPGALGAGLPEAGGGL